MRLTHIAFHVGLAIVAMLSNTFAAVSLAVDRFVDAMLAIASESPNIELAGGFGMQLGASGHSLDPALRQSMRHESRVSRRSADRNT